MCVRHVARRSYMIVDVEIEIVEILCFPKNFFPLCDSARLAIVDVGIEIVEILRFPKIFFPLCGWDS